MGRIVYEYQGIVVEIPKEDDEIAKVVEQQMGGIKIYKKNGSVLKSIVPKKIDKKMPTSTEVMKFIENQDKFRHTISDVSEYFLGFKMNNVKKRKDEYIKIYRRIRTARNKIQARHNGKWRSKKIGTSSSSLWKPTVWEFIKEK